MLPHIAACDFDAFIVSVPGSWNNPLLTDVTLKISGQSIFSARFLPDAKKRRAPMDTAFFSVSFRRSLRQLSSLRSFHCSAPQTFPVPHPRLRLLLPYRSRHFSGTRCKSCKANRHKHRRTRPSHRSIGKRIVKRVSGKSLRLVLRARKFSISTICVHDMRFFAACISSLPSAA